VLNVGLVVVMVGPLGWGVAGAAWATVVAQAVSVALCLLYVRRRLPVLHLRRSDWRVSRVELREHLRIGMAMGVQTSIIAIGTLTVQVALNELGADAVAAFTLGSRVESIAVALLSSLGLAASMFAAQNLGGKRPDRVRRGVVQATWMSIGAAVAIGALLIMFGEQLVRFFVGEGSNDVVDAAALMLSIDGFTYSLLGVLFILRGVLQGLGYTVVPTVTGVIELVMRVAAAVVLGSIFGFVGVVLSNPLAWLGSVALLIPAYVREHRRLGRLPVEPLAATPTTPVAVIGPVDGSMTVDAVVTGSVPVHRPAEDDQDPDLASNVETR
jgi:Na+-driven multidrug efflux pump